jgi:hypothetical protein
MPNVVVEDGYRLFFYANEGFELEPTEIEELREYISAFLEDVACEQGS